MNKKYSIFLSSTYEDLKEVRNNIMKSILKMYHFPIGMELFSAGNEQQWEVIKKAIDMTDYYVLILGHRYGSIDEESGVSYTEKEYDYAKEQGVPILSFIREENAKTSPDERDDDPKKKEKLEKFRKKAKKSICEFWDEPHELGEKISMALTKAFSEHPRTGWVRANETEALSTENNSINNIKREPNIDIEFNGEKELVLNYNKIEKQFYPEIIKKESVPPELERYIEGDDIKQYNDFITINKEEIEIYLENLSMYNNSMKNKYYVEDTTISVYVKVVVVKKVKIRVFLQRFNLNHSYLKYI